MQVVSAERVAALVADGDHVLIGGSGGGHAVPEALIAALGRRFASDGSPRGLTVVNPVGLGDEDRKGLGHLAQEGLLKRVIVGTLLDSPPIARMAEANAIEAYTLPLGALTLLMREMAAGRPGLITACGLHSFADPRHGGGRQNSRTTELLNEIVEIDGREWLRWRPLPVDVCLLRGTTADEDGNVSMEEEAVFADMLSMAQAARRAGAVVAVQVKRLAARHSLPPKQVKIPGILVDLVVVDPDQHQTYVKPFDPAYAGQMRVPMDSIPALPRGARKIVARRAAQELASGMVCNIGAGISNGIANVLAEEGALDSVVLTNEQGIVGGAPAAGVDAGAGTNYAALLDMPYQFDFYDGGGLDIAFLSFAELDAEGNVNVSRFGGRINGIGGFIDISQNARKVVFGGTFTAGGLELDIHDGGLRIAREGRHRKLVEAVEQLSYSAAYGRELGQEVVYVTERAVFRLLPDGLTLTEIAPGLDPHRDLVPAMAFTPRIAPDLRSMDTALFRPEPMGLARRIASRSGRRRPARLAGFEGDAS